MKKFLRTALRKTLLRSIFLLPLLPISHAAVAQEASLTVEGVVTDRGGMPVVGMVVSVADSPLGALTDINGHYVIRDVPADAAIVFAYIGFATQTIPVGGRTRIDVVMDDDSQTLGDLVVIGYGSVRKEDLTGSIASITEKDFQKGVVTTPGELLTGKVAGVQITSNGGRAGAGSRIRIRGGASLNASNDPLIVIDNVPIDNGGIAGSSDVLATLNPNDVESINILKDASATAIYGSRASNGVIIVTTKKGRAGQKLTVSATTQHSVAVIAREVDVMSADEFRSAVLNNPLATDAQKAMLGTADTDWQDEIFRTAYTTDNTVSVSGSVLDMMPYRVSAGYLNQDGILRNDNLQRTTASINLSPRFFRDHLSVNVNAKGTYSFQQFGNGDAIGAALRMDPTQPVTAPGFEQFNGYWTWMSGSVPNTLATYNPVAMLMSKTDEADVYRGIGNVQFDYKMHFLPELRANLNLGYDYSRGMGGVVIPQWAPQTYSNGGTVGDGGSRTKFHEEKQNALLEFYLKYEKTLPEFDSRFDVMAGYTYQDWKTTAENYPSYTYSGKLVTTPTYLTSVSQNTLISFYGRLNYTLMDRYLLTFTLRRDGSSRFSAENRWGTFPSVALAWRLIEEDFIKGVSALDDLKLRLGYGVTGQQEGIGNYDHLASYSQSGNTAQVQIGDSYWHMWRPNGYDIDRKWESTATYNLGIDFGMLRRRLSGSLDVYYKVTKDLLNEIPIPAGSNFTNQIVKNIGNLNNKGVEFSVNAIPVETKDWRWEISYNVTWNKTEITKLSLNDNPGSGYIGAQTGGISGGTGTTIQIHSVGYAPYAFYVYKQIYDDDGNPIEGAYADLNGDGIINSGDMYHYKKSEPDVYMGFSTTLAYKHFTLTTALRASLGNYMYNNVSSSMGSYAQVLNASGFLQNTVRSITATNFYNQNVLSDYYIENASFLKMDYVTLGYDFSHLLGALWKPLTLRANFTVQNVFTVTRYTGVDPEIAGGIDNDIYPRPRTFALGISIGF